MKISIAPDVPQWLLDIFNKVDFEKVSGLKKTSLLIGIDQWAARNIPFKDSQKIYRKSNEVKKISRDFDPKLLEILNKYDYAYVDSSKKQMIVNYLNSLLGSMIPIKKGK